MHVSVNQLASGVDYLRKKFNGEASRKSRSETGQFLTPASIAQFMASLFSQKVKQVRILDPGAGAGSLFAACVAELCNRKERPQSIEVIAYEIDDSLVSCLMKTMDLCCNVCREAGVLFDGNILHEDFIQAALEQTEYRLLASEHQTFTHAILNPPYKKINGQSRTRKLLDEAGMGTSNLYTAFVSLATQMLESNGELVAITPRSFCNGPYFRRFRKVFLGMTSLRHIHIFESRKKVFSDDAVLQENIIFHAVRNRPIPEKVNISSTKGVDFNRIKTRAVPYEQIVLPDDSDMFIHLVQDENDDHVMECMDSFNSSLEKLGVEVSTGRVVDFRSRDFLRQNPSENTVPLIYPRHFRDGFVEWPEPDGKKPNAIVSCSETDNLMVASGYYVLTKRFTAKEERRRIVATVFDPQRCDATLVGFENHLNYFHAKGKGMPERLAKGLALFLNSTLFDAYFRLFSGHTQVNATDLRKMRYPLKENLLRLGGYVQKQMPNQEIVDKIMEEEFDFDEQYNKKG